MLTSLALAASAALVPGLATPASAEAAPSVTAATNSYALSSSSESTTLTGLTATGATSTDHLQVVVSTTRGTLAFPQTGGLTLSYGNKWAGTDTVDFVGTASDVNTALASAQLVGDDTVGDAKVTMTAFEAGADDVGTPVFSASNGHFYQYVEAPRISWTDARAQAKALSYRGQSGYLATIPDDRINELLAARVEGATNVWFGGAAVNTPGEPVQRTWSWADGPLAGSVFTECTNLNDTCDTAPVNAYSHWAPGEPNNASGIESATVINWNGVRGEWNDLMNYELYSFLPLGGYLVEYGDQAVGAAGGFTGVATTSATIPMVTQAPDVAPGKVVDLASTPGSGSANLTFKAPLANGGPAVTGYQIKLGDGNWATITPQLTNGTFSYQATALYNGVSYVIQVRAVNAVGAGAPQTTTVTPVKPSVKPVVITARDVTHAWGLANPTFTATVTGLTGSDSLIKQPTCKVASNTANVGSYPIVCSAAKASSSYTLSYQPGTLTVTKAPTSLAVSRVPGSKSFKPTATLARSDTGAAISGQTVSLSVGGSATGCTAVTNTHGVATCKTTYTVGTSVTGVFAGSVNLAGSSGKE